MNATTNQIFIFLYLKCFPTRHHIAVSSEQWAVISVIYELINRAYRIWGDPKRELSLMNKVHIKWSYTEWTRTKLATLVQRVYKNIIRYNHAMLCMHACMHANKLPSVEEIIKMKEEDDLGCWTLFMVGTQNISMYNLTTKL